MQTSTTWTHDDDDIAELEELKRNKAQYDAFVRKHLGIDN